MREQKLTMVDHEAMALMPDEQWFSPTGLSYKVRSPYARCQRLERMGRLMSKVVGEPPYNLSTLFWKFSDLELSIAARAAQHSDAAKEGKT